LFGAACIDFTNLAKNGAQAYICYYHYLWDIAPGLLLVKEAGAVYSGINKPYSFGDHSLIVANNEKTLKMILETINETISNAK
jgi:fructose-1,6-bisphosphatase/inositol monophosphatase family enzyme